MIKRKYTSHHFDSELGRLFQFNRKPAEGIKFLLTENLLPNDPKFIARFLHDTPGLNKVLFLHSFFNVSTSAQT